MLDTLRRIVQEVSSAPTLQDTLHIIVERVRESIDAEACSIFLHDKRQDDYVLMATEGLNKAAVGRIRLNKSNSLVGVVAQREEPLNIEDAPLHPKFHYVSNAGEEKFRAFLGVPIIHQRRVLGVLIVQQQEARCFDETEEAFLVTLSAQLAGVIAHAEATGLMAILASGVASDEATFTGMAGAEGIAIGVAVAIYPLADLNAVPDRPTLDTEAEISRFEAALHAAREEIRHLGERMTSVLAPEESALFDVYQKILDRSSLGEEVVCIIRNEKKWAQWALCQVIKKHIRQFEAMDDAYLKERAEDIEDLGKRVLSHLQSKEHVLPDYPDNTILIGDEISATNLAEVPEKKLAGIVSGRGSSNSHVAILARALGVPTVMGVDGFKVSQLEGRELVVDGYFGQVYVSPSTALRNEFLEIAAGEKALEADLAEMRDLPAQTADGFRISLLVNTGLAADISRSLSVGAEGVGLYRTEIPFMIRERFPTEKEQRAIYQQLLAAFAPRPVIMRTLDVGGDKPLPYLPIQEDNPFLGWRGIRVTLDHPEIFLVQLRAMLRANRNYNNLRILFPMISTTNELKEAMRLLTQAHLEVSSEGVEMPLPPVGVMIEVPSAVYQARSFAQQVDFLSVGSNDLTQYMLAVDRNNPRVANLYDCLHPAVLRAMQYVAESAHKEGKVASVCGEMSGDPVAAILLLAMGFDSLSMNASSLPRIKWLIRRLNMQQAHETLEQVLLMEEPAVIRCHLELYLEQLGLGSLIRAGRK